MQPANSQEALAQLQQTQQSSQNPNDILANQRQQLGVQGAEDTVTGLRGAINNTTKLLKQVAPSVMGRTGSSLVTNAQATKQISNEQAPISANLAEQGTNYGQANEDLGRLQDRAKEAASGIYTGQQDKLSYAQNLYNILYKKEQDASAAAQAERDRQEAIRQFNEQLAVSKKSAAGSGGFDLGSYLNGGGAAAAAGPSQQELQAASQINTLRQLDGADLGAAIKGLRDRARQGDALAKTIGQKYYQAIGKSIPFAEFK